jgi:hypothetical protein
MKNFNTVLILLWILSSSILIVENMVLWQNAFVYIANSSTSMLSIASIITGILMWYGIKWKLSENNVSEETDFNF